MKNLSRLFLTIALLLGVSVQGFGQSLMISNYQFGNILLEIGMGEIFRFLFVLIMVLILVQLFSSKKQKSSDQLGIPTVGDWLGRFLIAIIPVVGFITLIVWAVDDKDKIRKNWAIALIISTIFLIMLFYYLGHLFTAYLMEWMGRF